jgi:hypothetical protein
VTLWKPAPGDLAEVERQLRAALADGHARVASGDPDGHNLITLAEDALDALARGEDGSLAGHLAYIETHASKLKSWDAQRSARKGGERGSTVGDRRLRDLLAAERNKGTPGHKRAAAISTAANLSEAQTRKRLNALDPNWRN